MELTHAPVAPLQQRDAVSAQRAPAAPVVEPAHRLASLDVFRGLTMLFMASEIMRIPAVAGSSRTVASRGGSPSGSITSPGPASCRGT